MMQKVLTKYWLTIHVGLLLVFPLLFLTQSRAGSLVPLLWLSFVAFETLLLLPSVHRGETLADARNRVIRDIVRDPFSYLGLAFLVFVVIQWLNSGCKLVYFSEADVWRFSLPAVAWAPFSIETQSSLTWCSIAVACFVGCLCLRHAVSRTGKRYLLHVAVLVSGIVAIFSVFQACRGVTPYVGYVSDRWGNVLGSFFGFWLMMGMGAFVDDLAHGKRWYVVLFVVGFIGNLLGVLFFAGALFLVIYAVLSLFISIYWLLYLNPVVPKPVQLKLFLMLCAVVAGITVFLLYIFPGNPVVVKMREFVPVDHYWHSLSETKNVRTSAAMKIWQDHPWVGVGPEGFRHFVGSVVNDKDWKLIETNQASVYNDTVQFLCEYGLLGFGLLFSSVVMLIVPLVYRVRLAWKYGVGGEESEGRFFLFRISPLVLTGTIAIGICALESLMGSPFRSPSVLLSWSIVLSMLPAFLPAKTQSSP